VDAEVDPENTVDECVETNNTASASFTVYPEPEPNLALHKSVTVSSVERTGLEGKYAVDGNMGTRWSSAASDPQNITVDLGTRMHITNVMLYWETAYARSYAITISDSGSRWDVPVYVTAGDGGIDVHSINADARYVKMVGLQRGTMWGYSLYELVVHGASSTTAVSADPTLQPPGEVTLLDNYPNPFNSTTVVRFELPAAGYASLGVYDPLGREVVVLLDGFLSAGDHAVQFRGDRCASGIYYYRLSTAGTSGDKSRVKKMVLIK
jgi:hypothetical protein